MTTREVDQYLEGIGWKFVMKISAKDVIYHAYKTNYSDETLRVGVFCLATVRVGGCLLGVEEQLQVSFVGYYPSFGVAQDRVLAAIEEKERGQLNAQRDSQRKRNPFYKSEET